MSELENTTPVEENANPCPAETTADVLKNAEDGEKQCSAVENVAECAETESPAEMISEETDRIESSQKEEMKKYTGMTKQELADEMKRILADNDMNAHKEVASIKHAFFYRLNKEADEALAAYVDEGNDPETFSSAPDAVEAEMKGYLQEFREKRAAYLNEIENQQKANLEKKNEILSQMREIADDIDNINLKFPQFQQLQQDFKAIKEIPAGAETEIWKNFQAIGELFYDRLKMNKELRDLDFKKNLDAKRQIIEEANALASENDVIAAFRKLQDLHSQWREIGPVAKDLRDSIWEEFKNASTVVNKRHQEFFENKKANEQANEEAKTKLCEEIEAIDIDALKSFSVWDASTKEVIALQERWKQIGFASHKVNAALFARFRKACDEFFNSKAEYYKRIKAEYASNLEKKTELCNKVEALKETDDLKAALDEVQKLQAEWKKIGTVARKYNDAIWQRFNTACNYFFDERKKQYAETRKEEMANLEQKRAVIARLKEISPEMDRSEGIRLVRDLQNDWQQIGHVPFKMKDRIYEEYRGVVDSLYEVFNMKETNRRMSNFEGQIEGLKSDEGKLNFERDRQFRALEQKRGELKTYENNMGFFNVKSSAGNSMLKEMERKIKRIKEEIALLEKKIELIDSKMN